MYPMQQLHRLRQCELRSRLVVCVRHDLLASPAALGVGELIMQELAVFSVFSGQPFVAMLQS